MDAAIKLLTRGYGTHASFVRGNGKIIENFWPHVRERAWLHQEGANVELYRIEGTTSADWLALERWFDGQMTNPPSYSVRDLFRYAFDMPPVRGPGCFCSQWVLRGCRLNLDAGKQPLVRLEYLDFAAPRDLRISPRLVRVYVAGINAPCPCCT